MKFEVIPDEQTPLTPQIEDVSKFIETHKEEIEAFKEYAFSRTDGIGLAANQCSLDGKRFNLRMAAIKTDTKNPENCRIAIDPKIVKYHGREREEQEGCLTWKGKSIVANRHEHVDVEFYTPDGEFHQETHSNFQAQVWQHELNHINGIKEDVRDENGKVIPITSNKIGRNDPCPCGSGKKHKKCCL
jgi:peptide deformylase